jgi:hypothetical protein
VQNLPLLQARWFDGGKPMNDPELRTIEVDGEEIQIVDDMIFGGTFSCLTCNVQSHEAVNINGTLYWICPNGHNSKVVLYE